MESPALQVMHDPVCKLTTPAATQHDSLGPMLLPVQGARHWPLCCGHGEGRRDMRQDVWGDHVMFWLLPIMALIAKDIWACFAVVTHRQGSPTNTKPSLQAVHSRSEGTQPTVGSGATAVALSRHCWQPTPGQAIQGPLWFWADPSWTCKGTWARIQSRGCRSGEARLGCTHWHRDNPPA